MLADEKERSEHLMLVDLGRNDLGRVCVPGTVRVEDYSHIERYSHVMHIVSTVTGLLADGRTALDAVTACFPAGTLTGAPKVRAMELIEGGWKKRPVAACTAVSWAIWTSPGTPTSRSPSAPP